MTVHITLASGETLTATDGHPFKTTDGWRDAIMLKKGGQLLLKGDGEPPKTGAAQAGNTATIADVSTETRIVKVFNLEVANAHTYFVGKEGVGVHNSGRSGKQPRLRELGEDDKQASHIRGWIEQELNLIKCKKRKTIRVPPGYEMAHRRGYPAKEGNSYKYSDPQNPDLHDLQHKYEGY